MLYILWLSTLLSSENLVLRWDYDCHKILGVCLSVCPGQMHINFLYMWIENIKYDVRCYIHLIFCKQCANNNEVGRQTAPYIFEITIFSKHFRIRIIIENHWINIFLLVLNFLLMNVLIVDNDTTLPPFDKLLMYVTLPWYDDDTLLCCMYLFWSSCFSSMILILWWLFFRVKKMCDVNKTKTELSQLSFTTLSQWQMT